MVRKEVMIIKVRIVYDVLLKLIKMGIFLNDCLYVGLLLNLLLFDILLWFWENRVVFVGDIEKVFFNVGVDKRDRDCFWFLWLENFLDILRIVVYWFCCVVFGLNVFFFLLNVILRYYILKFIVVDFEFVKKLIDLFYVDDFVGGGVLLSEVVDLYSKMVNCMVEGGFKFRKWLINDVRVRERIKKDLIDDVKCDLVLVENVMYVKLFLGLKMGSNG